MVLAQRFRLRLLQHHETGDAFGPEVLTNIFIVACVPFVYYLLGIEVLSWLFLINAVIAVVLYASSERTASLGKKTSSVDSPIFRQAIAVGLVLPVFFQLTGRIFRDKVPALGSGGDLLNLPIPISVIVCYGAIVVIGRYDRARESLTVILLCFCLMLLSTVLFTHGQVDFQQTKIILLIQFMLPMLALVVGQIYEGSSGAEGNVAKACIYVVGLMIPLQLVATWVQKLPVLSSYLYVFSVYQHLQYVPVVLVCAFVIACFSLWPDKLYRTALMVLAIPIGAYAMLSLSMLTVGGLLIGTATFVAYRFLPECGKGQKSAVLLLLMVAFGIYGANPVVNQTLRSAGKMERSFEMLVAGRTGDSEVSATQKVYVAPDAAVTQSITQRVEIWQIYVDEIMSAGNDWAFGHQSPLDRNLYSSAHNYYLDFVYNFGLIALILLMWLVASTLWKSGRHWKQIAANPEFFAITGAVLFLLVVDNSLKVGLRQPYSGIFTFFLWGVLLSRLGELGRSAGTHNAEG